MRRARPQHSAFSRLRRVSRTARHFFRAGTDSDWQKAMDEKSLVVCRPEYAIDISSKREPDNGSTFSAGVLQPFGKSRGKGLYFRNAGTFQSQLRVKPPSGSALAADRRP